jgi:hypothetical protein
MLSRNDGIYTKNEAFGLLKKELSIPRNALIFQDFFDLFFYRTGDCLYVPLMDDVTRQNFLITNKVKETNSRIFAIKKQKPLLGKKLYNSALMQLKHKVYLP